VEPRKVLLVLMLTILLVSCAIVWFYPPIGDFRTDNPSWNGYSELSRQTNATALEALSDLPSQGRGTALILVPYEQFTQQELTEINSYVASGGELILLDDYGYGNQVLSSQGLAAKFSGKTLLDPLFDYKNKWFPTITEFPATTANVNVSSIVLNHATYLDQTTGVTPLAYSSSFSFADINGDENWNSSDASGPLPVAAYAKVNQGYVVIISDPSIAINSMLGLGENAAFINKILSIQGSDAQVYIDQSHLPNTPLDESKAVLATVYGIVASPWVTLTLIAVAMAYSFKRFWKRGNT
jgi:hypothetical protein